MRARIFISSIAAVLLTVAGCARSAPLFSEQNARVHVSMLAGTIGSRPIGSEANARAREYIVDQLKLFGYGVRVQETDARRPELGRSAHVFNVIAVLPGTRQEAVGLVAHYDSAPESPGGSDDGLGVAVVLETARVLAARPNRNWTVMVLLTDGEEAGLMGAAAVMTDREVTSRLGAYVQVESAGSTGPALLFETGPRNGWLVSQWARNAPHPRGGSLAVEIYRRLPNDTDFSIIKRHEIPGLNFATVADSYAYHTARDTAERLSSRTLRETGENVVAVATALDTSDITRRSATAATYFDLAGASAVSYGSTAGWFIAGIALILGVVAWVRVTTAAVRISGLARWLLEVVWTGFGALAVTAAMVGTTWALRAAREVYHPWYARPDRLLFLLAIVGLSVGWGVGRIGRWLPPKAHGLRHPVVAWTIALPVWIAAASLALWFAPDAAYLWTVPLLVAALCLVITPPSNAPAVRIASIVVLAAAGTLWLRDTLDLLRFVVAVFGRLPVVTPVFVYACGLAAAGLMVVPPFVAAVAPERPLLRPSAVTAVLLLGVAIAAAMAYRAAAYTPDEPLRRYVRAVQEADAPNATWEVASTEPGLDLAPEAPQGWTPGTGEIQGSVPWFHLPHPFVFRATGPSLGPAPVAASARLQPVPNGVELSVSAVPAMSGLTISFVLPRDVVPARHNLPGISRAGRWTATFVAPPPEGIELRASFGAAAAARLRDVHVAVFSPRFPGGAGWQALPPWLPTEHMVWSATAAWSVPLLPVGAAGGLR
jgi:peptidase M28-like protein